MSYLGLLNPRCNTMKLKIAHKNKLRLAQRFKLQRNDCQLNAFNASQITYDSLCKLKQLGQRYHQQRLERQQKMNPRQLKKLRKRQIRLGLVGSKYGGICKTKLKPATAFHLSRSPN